MANSTSANLKLTVQATGENSGTWGQITNTNLLILEQAIGGYDAIGVTSGATLSFTNGALSDGKNQVLKLIGTIAGAVNVVVPDSIEKTYVIQNSTSGAYAVTVKTNSGTGVTWAADDKGTKMVYSDGTNIVDTAFTDLSSDYTPQLSADLDTNGNNIIIDSTKSILDESSNEQITFTTTSAAVNNFGITNAATGNTPSLAAVGGDSNIGINLNPKGTGVLKSASSAVKIAGLETIWVPASAMYETTTNGASPDQIETTALRPDMKVMDFADSADDHAQFSVAFPKSWNEGTVTYQCFWTPSTTNTGDCIFGLQGVAIGDGDTIDVAYGTAVTVTDAGIGTVEDQQVSAVSSALTIAGSPAVDQQTYFQIFRDANAGGDTYTGVARLLGIKIFYTTDAANDA